MALRVMQIYLPLGANGSPDELLSGRVVLGRWRDSETSQTVLHLLVPAEETEPIMDRFEQQYSSVEGFHVVLFPVEAVLPRPERHEPAEAPAEIPAEEPPPPSHRINREELFAQANDGIGINRVFVGMTIISALVAAVGLIRNDVAVIIGAMVIAPLLGPNVAMTLAATLGETDLFRRALLTNLIGLAIALLFAIAVGAIFQIDPEVASIAARTELRIGDIILALAAGLAGSLAFTRGQAGAVIGVMVAVALMPPLVVCGMLLGSGHFNLALGAFLLTAANVICVNLAGVVTFIAQGVRPSGWRETVIARRDTRRAIVIWLTLLALLMLVLWLGVVSKKSLPPRKTPSETAQVQNHPAPPRVPTASPPVSDGSARGFPPN